MPTNMCFQPMQTTLLIGNYLFWYIIEPEPFLHHHPSSMLMIYTSQLMTALRVEMCGCIYIQSCRAPTGWSVPIYMCKCCLLIESLNMYMCRHVSVVHIFKLHIYCCFLSQTRYKVDLGYSWSSLKSQSTGLFGAIV